MECKAAGVSVTKTQGQELKALDEVKRLTERHGRSFRHSPHNFPPVHLLDSISSLFLKKWFIFSFFFWGEEAALPWSFSALHHTLFAPNPAERVQTWLCANPLKTFKAIGANPSVTAASPWHSSSLVSELTLRVCSHEMWRLPPDQWCCSPRPPPFRLTDIWHLTGETLEALLPFDWRGTCHTPDPVNQRSPANPFNSLRGSTAGSWLSAPTSGSSVSCGFTPLFVAQDWLYGFDKGDT